MNNLLVDIFTPFQAEENRNELYCPPYSSKINPGIQYYGRFYYFLFNAFDFPLRYLDQIRR